MMELVGAYRFNGMNQVRKTWLAVACRPQNDHLTSIIYPDSTQVNYTRNALGEITTITATLPGQPAQALASNISYQPFGGIKALIWGNGLTLSRSFDQDYRIDQQSVGGIQSLNYGYDQLSNITSINDAIDAHNTGSYDYDLLNRMIEESKTEYLNSFSYDEVGNRTEQTNNNLVAQTSEAKTNTYGDTSNRLATKNGTTQSYDEVGNIINNGTYGFTYDVSNRMAAASQGGSTLASYTHNALGQRVTKTRPNSANAYSAAYIYNPAGQLISETTYNSAGVEQESKHYVWLGTVPVAMLQPAANDADQKVIYLHTDHLDAPRKATDQNQQVVWQWQSDAFGTSAANDDVDGDTVATVINLRFPGQYYDQETELHYNYFRDYDPEVGRYVQSDPIGLVAGLNTYGYVYQNPVKNIDPFGLDVNVCYYSGVIPHVGIGVNTTNTTGRRTDGTQIPVPGRDVPGEVSPDSGEGQCTVMSTTPEEDQAVQDYIDKNVANPGTYNLIERSCVDFVRDGLARELGLPLSDTNFPKNLYNEVRLNTGDLRQTRRGSR